jgi:hypothetical protein
VALGVGNGAGASVVIVGFDDGAALDASFVRLHPHKANTAAAATAIQMTLFTTAALFFSALFCSLFLKTLIEHLLGILRLAACCTGGQGFKLVKKS